MIAFLRRKFLSPLLELLRRGLAPDELALSLALGAALGLFPVLGSTMLLCTLAALLLRLNLVAIQVANYAVYPLQVLLLIPFMRLGSTLFGAEVLPLDAASLFGAIRDDVWLAVSSYWWATVHAIGAWSVAVPVPALAAYIVLRLVLRRAARRQREARSEC